MIDGAQTPLALARQGIARREAGAFDEAGKIFDRLIREWPNLSYGWKEMAVLHAGRGRDAEALALFEHAVALAPGDLHAGRYLFLHRLRLGLHEAARASLGEHIASAPGAEAREMLAQADFMETFPAAVGTALAADFESRPSYLTTEMAGWRILDAVDTGTAFCLIRLGDGEGAWLDLSDEDRQRFAPLYEANRHRTLRTWFGTTTLAYSTAYSAAMDRMAGCAAAADLLGIPHAGRLKHEYNLASANGVASNVNILRWLNQTTRKDQFYCSQDIHVRLHLEGFFPRLFARPAEFGLISCHAGLGLQLAEMFSMKIVSQLVVPEEVGAADVDPDVISLAGLTGFAVPHFPIVYQRHLARLRAPQQGRVWLIAAGVLGKIYAGAVAAAGGVALDIGSIADGWMGKATRPYLRQTATFQL